jgi:hypothetical protein
MPGPSSRASQCPYRFGDLIRWAARNKFNPLRRRPLAIAERLAKADPGNADWQRDLSVSHNTIGDVQVEQATWRRR